MGLSNAEVKLRRLLASMPNQDNSRKLVHYVATARELLVVLCGENSHTSLSSISPDKAKEYAQQIETFADKLTELPDVWDVITGSKPKIGSEATTASAAQEVASSSLRKRPQVVKQEESQEIKLDTATQDFISKHRRLQDDLTDEMVVFAQQMKESTLLMHQSLQDTEKVLDSTSDAVEHSLASTQRATRKAGEVYSRGSLTGCYTWLLIFAMFCVFIFMIAVIRIT